MSSVLAALIDEYGELSRQLDAMKPAVVRHKVLAQEIQAHFENAPAGETIVVDGSVYQLQILPRDNQTRIRSMSKVYRALGQKLFIELCSITLKAVRENLASEVYESLVLTERTGLRPLKAVARAAASKAA